MTGDDRSTGPTGSTTVAAVIGWPVRHSLSPAIHNAAFAAAGLDWVYLALPVPPGSVSAAVAGMRALGIERTVGDHAAQVGGRGGARRPRPPTPSRSGR